VVEDLHWADEKLLDFLDQLVERLTDVAVLVVATARPELLQRRESWGGGKANAATLSLPPLDKEEMAGLLDALVDGAARPPEVQAAVLARADGNPLFAEQYARMLSEHGGERELPLPESVQGIIAARLDGLPRAEKELLHDAAVHGKVFWAGALEAMSGAAAGALDEPLRALERKEFVRRQRRSSVAGETELAFRHALVREVAYGQIPRAPRADKHRLAAEWLESLAHDRDDLVELLADHYSRALELARAAGRADTAALEARARATLRDAGVRAATLNAFAAALRYLDGALALWPPEDEERPHLLALRARALHFLGAEEAAEALTKARDGLLAIGDAEAAAELEPLLAELWWERGDRERALAQLEQALSLLDGRGASRAKASILCGLARYRSAVGEGEEALTAGKEARAIAQALTDSALEGEALYSTIMVKVRAGDIDAAVQDLERALELMLAVNSPAAIEVCISLQDLLWVRGELDRAGAAGREAERLARRYGDARMLRFSRIFKAGWLWAHGRWDEALEIADEFIAECEDGRQLGFGADQTTSLQPYPARSTPPAWESSMRELRAGLRTGRGDNEGASADAEKAIQLARRASSRWLVSEALATAVEASLLGGRPGDARRCALELLASFEDPRITASHHVLHSLAVAAGDLGLEQQVGELIGRGAHELWSDAARAIVSGDLLGAADIWEGLHLGPKEAHLRLLAAKAFLAEGRREEADEQLQRALAFFRKAGATRFIEEAESLLQADA
jgi:tetratricopeptide (TPR) repeat protein